MREIVLDTETTGFDPETGDRIVEIGAVELKGHMPTGNTYHQYINPEREIDAGALEVHGISNDFLADKPVFARIAEEFLEFIAGAELVIHNAAFDVGFIEYELQLLGHSTQRLADLCTVVDTLKLARDKHPGQKNNLDALCKRYEIDNSRRSLHGALLDSEILADVYLAMTGGQTSLLLGGDDNDSSDAGPSVKKVRPLERGDAPLAVIEPAAEELRAHQALLERIEQKSEGRCLWLHAEEAAASN